MDLPGDKPSPHPIPVLARSLILDEARDQLDGDALCCAELYLDDGWSLRSIAEALDLPIEVVRDHLGEALPRLRAALGWPAPSGC